MTDFYSLSEDDQAARLAKLARAALGRWPGEYDDLRLIKYRENAVFSAHRDDGARVAVRVHRHAYHSDSALRSELLWMQALADEGIEVPPILTSRDGRMFETVSAPGIPEPRQVDVLGWLPGRPVGTSEEGLQLEDMDAQRLFFEAGVLAAKMHNHVAKMEFGEDFVRHAWDADGLIGPDPFWGRFMELKLLKAEESALLAEAQAQAERDLAAFGRGPHNYGLIHADFVPENLLFEEGRLKLIDFDDSGFGWHMFDLATALYFNLDHAAYDVMEAALFEGYRTARALPDDHQATLPLFLFLRSTTYLGWVQTRPETQTARELGPFLVERCCLVAKRYLGHRTVSGATG